MSDNLAYRIEKFYTERIQKKWNGGLILNGKFHAGPNAIQLWSCDYLDLGHNSSVVETMCDSICKEGAGFLASARFQQTGTPSPSSLNLLETEFARFMHAEATVLCQSGYAANVGLIQSIASSDTTVYISELGHMSFYEGILSAGAKMVKFVHNDVTDLKKQILLHGAGVVVVDAVNNVYGAIAPLKEITDICSLLGCILVVDESHWFGTHGPKGAGLLVEYGIEDRVHFRTASLAKAFASRAGIVSCSKKFQLYFKYESNPHIFSSAILPHDIKGMQKTLSIIEKDDWRRVRLAENAKYLHENLSNMGYNLHGSQTHVIFLEAGKEEDTIVLRDVLESQGIFGSVFCAPATPANGAGVRFCINSSLTKEQLKKIVSVCANIRGKIKMMAYPFNQQPMKPKIENDSCEFWIRNNTSQPTC